MRPAAAGSALLPALVLTACAAASTSVTPPHPTGPAARACTMLADDLPDTVTGLSRTPTQPASVYVAAWGSGVVVLRCGVDRPAGLVPGVMLVSVDGVDWYVEDVAGGPAATQAGDATQAADATAPGVRFTTAGRVAYVEVLVRGPRAQAAGRLTDLARPVQVNVPLTVR